MTKGSDMNLPSLVADLMRFPRRGAQRRDACRSRRRPRGLEASERLEPRVVLTASSLLENGAFLGIPPAPAGGGAESAGVAVKAAATRVAVVPDAPSVVTGKVASGKVDLKWKPPASNGGAAIRDYVIQYSSDSGASWSTFADPRSPAVVARCTGLTNGTPYVFRIAAVNRVGTGGYSAASAPLVPRTIAGLPTGVAGGAADRQVSLSWSAPVSDGGSPVTDYLIQYRAGGTGAWKSFKDGVSAATSATVTGLVNGKSYAFRVAAVNAAGTSAYSTVSTGVIPLPLAAPPTGVVAAAGVRQAGLTWQAPAAPPAAPVTGYVVQYSSDAGATWTTFSDALPAVAAATVTGLGNGTEYVFRVAAKNLAGVGGFSAPSAPVKTAAAVTYQMSHVGNPGNAADDNGYGTYGAVAYDYQIGTYDVTIAQYCAFLNAIGSRDEHGCWVTGMETDRTVAGIARSGDYGSYVYTVIDNGGDSSNRPVTHVAWYSALRFANWMANGQPTGFQTAATTEEGAYSFSQAAALAALPTRQAVNPNTGATPTFFLPTEDEWYKAAYYSPEKYGPGNPGYYAFATQSDVYPVNTGYAAPNAGNVYAGAGLYFVTQSGTYDPQQNYLTDVGAFTASASYYGTYDQFGNVRQWVDKPGYAQPIVRGSDWSAYQPGFFYQSSAFRMAGNPDVDNGVTGFRLAAYA